MYVRVGGELRGGQELLDVGPLQPHHIPGVGVDEEKEMTLPAPPLARHTLAVLPADESRGAPGGRLGTAGQDALWLLDLPCNAWPPCTGAYPHACLGCLMMEQRSIGTVSDGFSLHLFPNEPPCKGRGCIPMSSACSVGRRCDPGSDQPGPKTVPRQTVADDHLHRVYF